MSDFDVLIIGGGIAGSGLAYELSSHLKVLQIEAEDRAGYHTTGRSAALYIKIYGSEPVRILTVASEAFFRRPPEGFCDHDLTRPRGWLVIGSPDQMPHLEAEAAVFRRLAPGVRLLDLREIQAMVPVLRPEVFAGGLLDPDARSIDVDALLQAYLRGARRNGASFVPSARATAITRSADCWEIETTAARFSAAVVVNAAGAWADPVAELAGVTPLAIQPKRRTAITFDAESWSPAQWPATCEADESFYFMPEAGAILASPADESPSLPCDAQPEEIDIATIADRIERATLMRVKRIKSSWAGLRSFSPDRSPVVGFDSRMPGFFWLVGQGGYGIHTAPAMSRLAAAWLQGHATPPDIADLGLDPKALRPARFQG